MANQQDQQAIDTLFNRIEDVARNSGARDRDAETQIQQRLREFPPSPYYMAQTIIIQERALEEAQARIEQLEAGQRQTGWVDVRALSKRNASPSHIGGRGGALAKTIGAGRAGVSRRCCADGAGRNGRHAAGQRHCRHVHGRCAGAGASGRHPGRFRGSGY